MQCPFERGVKSSFSHVQLFTYRDSFSKRGFPYIAGHLPVVPIHVVGTFTLADDGGVVSVEPGVVRSEVKFISVTLEMDKNASKKKSKHLYVYIDVATEAKKVPVFSKVFVFLLV